VTAARASQARELLSCEGRVWSAAQLIRRKGRSGAGTREIVAEAGAPRGSLQHYFSGGKEDLSPMRCRGWGDVSARCVRRFLKKLQSRTSVRWLRRSWNVERRCHECEIPAGCPLVAAAADTAETSQQMRQALGRAFDGWLEPFAESLVELGVPARAFPNLCRECGFS
jgi:AcrR family transcriptional regulator